MIEENKSNRLILQYQSKHRSYGENTQIPWGEITELLDVMRFSVAFVSGFVVGVLGFLVTILWLIHEFNHGMGLGNYIFCNFETEIV